MAEQGGERLESPVGAALAEDGAYLYVPDGTYRIGFTDFFGAYQQPLYFDGVDTLGDARDVVVAGLDVPIASRAFSCVFGEMRLYLRTSKKMRP